MDGGREYKPSTAGGQSQPVWGGGASVLPAFREVLEMGLIDSKQRKVEIFSFYVGTVSKPFTAWLKWS